MKLTRREALGGAAGLFIALALPGCKKASDGSFVPNAWLEITADGRIIFTLDRTEMGQGVMTSHATLLAEELEVAPEKLEIRFASADRKYDNPEICMPLVGMVCMQMTGGSTSTKGSWEPLRQAGATAREALRAAAAEIWGVPAAECRAVDGAMWNLDRRLSYGECASKAAKHLRDTAALKTADFKWIGKPYPRLDARAKSTGTAGFGIDVRVPGMKTAVIVRCPVLGGKLVRFDKSKAEAVPGVEKILELPAGIGIVAKSYWPARSAAELLLVEWSESALSSESIRESYEAALQNEAKSVHDSGDVDAALSAADKAIEATYECPFVAHAPMEPQNATAHVRADGVEIWAPTQAPGTAKELAARITGFDLDQIVVHNTFIGGGFGRRIAQDYVAEAVHLSKAIGAPVQVLWSREDDMRHSMYRPASLHRLKGGVKAGQISAWWHRQASQSILSKVGSDFVSTMLPGWVPSSLRELSGDLGGKSYAHDVLPDATAVEGSADMPYAIADRAMQWAYLEPGVPIGFWRSVGHSYSGFVIESFFDELCHAAGADPFEARKKLLAGAPRNLAVLELAAQKAGWGTQLEAGRGRGIAQHASFASYAAQVAEVTVKDGEVKVDRIVCAFDCGRVINPSIVRAQVESAIVFGLGAALKHEITYEAGQVVQSNFHDFPVIRMDEMPEIEVYLVESTAPPTGVGEPGVPPVAPAVANAIFAATGQRLRKLPLRLE